MTTVMAALEATIQKNMRNFNEVDGRVKPGQTRGDALTRRGMPA
jgi:hypothetical protein